MHFSMPPYQVHTAHKTSGLNYEIKPGEDAVLAEVEVPGCSPADVNVSCEG